MRKTIGKKGLDGLDLQKNRQMVFTPILNKNLGMGYFKFSGIAFKCFRIQCSSAPKYAIVVTINNVLGVVAVTLTDTGPNSEESFHIYRAAVDTELLQLENASATINRIQGTLVRGTGGPRYRFSLQYSPHNQQKVVTIMRQ